MYVVRSADSPAPAALEQASQQEELFMKEYFERTGIQWRHFYGPDGPRPPPSLYMWPAKEIGDVHSVNTKQSHWYYYSQTKT